MHYQFIFLPKRIFKAGIPLLAQMMVAGLYSHALEGTGSRKQETQYVLMPLGLHRYQVNGEPFICFKGD